MLVAIFQILQLIRKFKYLSYKSHFLKNIVDCFDITEQNLTCSWKDLYMFY